MTYTIGTRSKPSRRCLSARRTAAVLLQPCRLQFGAGQQEFFDWFTHHHPELGIFGFGERIEVFKDVGLPDAVARRFDRWKTSIRHAHTRSYTNGDGKRSDDRTLPSVLEPVDLCLAHNGSLSNHNRLRQSLRREGIRFTTDNDTEVAAGYLTWRLGQGMSLPRALEAALADLDGFFFRPLPSAPETALQLRDPIACKPAVLAETGDWVAMATEYRAIATLLGAAGAEIWEPLPATVYSWQRQVDRGRPSRNTAWSANGNERLHQLIPQTNELHWRVLNPNGAHAVAVGITQPVQVEIRGHVGYYCAGHEQGGDRGGGRPRRHRARRKHHERACSRAGQCFAIRRRLGLRRARRHRGRRQCALWHLDEGRRYRRWRFVGHMTGFMGQAGRLVVCGDAGHDLGDLLDEAEILCRRRREPRSTASKRR